MSFITSFLSSCKSKVMSLSDSFVELFASKQDHVIRINARETPKEYMFYAEVPGVEMDDLHVEIIEDDKDYMHVYW
ncbi:hypothetical protein L195_g048623 [Trifolium pratense]|uniref:Uncharacterized protein n=1 Tax=Trifolium pratense TaxID=57577 RepID=A0A2K3JLU2_TRIPR|nr:hypothetical protein L195_g048623 [Trifolium pratense]